MKKKNMTPSPFPGRDGGKIPSSLSKVIETFRVNMQAEEAAQMRTMAQQWLSVQDALDARIAALAMRIAELQAEGKPVSLAKITQLEHYQRLLVQVKAETQKYSKWASDLITQRQKAMAKLGINSATESIRAIYADAGKVTASFEILPTAAVEAMAGYAGDGTPLSNLLQGSYPETAQRITQALVNATATGTNPRDTARLVRDAMDGNLQRALTIARTEQNRAYRSAATEQMKASGVVDGWIWGSAHQETTCAACLAMDGTQHSLDEELDDHPEGRCFRVPIVTGIDPEIGTTGQEWFESQPESIQREILGASKYEALKAGMFEFSALAQTATSEVWGTSVRVASLSELTADDQSIE
jgi:SPP1 gp7 family putative phage head morphogenesis protein